jgi:hypothetical protein
LDHVVVTTRRERGKKRLHRALVDRALKYALATQGETLRALADC